MTVLDLLFYLFLAWFFGDLIRKMFYTQQGDQIDMGPNHTRPNHQSIRLKNAFYDKDEFARLSRTEKLLSTRIYIQNCIQPLTFWNYISWGLDSRFQNQYRVNLILAFLLAVSMLAPAGFPWIGDIIFIIWIYFVADFTAYLQQRLKHVTVWDPEWMKHDCLRTGSIMED